MTKKSKFILKITLTILIIGGISYYFIYDQNKKVPEIEEPDRMEKFFEFKVVDKSLAEEQVDKYFERFTQDKNIILASEDKFNMAAFLDIGQVKKLIGDFDGSRDVFEYVSKMRPENSLSFSHLGFLYGDHYKDYKKAEINFKIALLNQPNDLDYIRNLYEFYRFKYKEKSPLALEILQAAVKDNPKNLTILAMIAEYYRDLGDKKKAKEYFEKILVIDPENEAAKRELERSR